MFTHERIKQKLQKKTQQDEDKQSNRYRIQNTCYNDA